MLYFVITNNLTRKEMTIEIDLTNLQWTKNVNHPDIETYWAYQHDQILYPFLVPEFKLHWKERSDHSDHNANLAKKGDIILLCQRTKVTHLVKVLDDQSKTDDPNSDYSLYRRVQVLWMAQEPWENAPDQEVVFGFDINHRNGFLKDLNNIEGLTSKFNPLGGITAFHAQVIQALGLGK
jgi:hypothetical protein